MDEEEGADYAASIESGSESIKKAGSDLDIEDEEKTDLDEQDEEKLNLEDEEEFGAGNEEISSPDEADEAAYMLEFEGKESEFTTRDQKYEIDMEEFEEMEEVDEEHEKGDVIAELKEKPRTVRENLEYVKALRLDTGSVSSRRISGDFKVAIDLRKPVIMEIISDEEEETKSISIPVSPTTSDDLLVKERLMARCLKLLRTKIVQEVRGRVLQATIGQYLKRRRMGYCLREFSGQTENALYKYKGKLNEYANFSRKVTATTELYERQIENLSMAANVRAQAVEQALKEFQRLIAYTGHGLIYTKSGKPLVDAQIQYVLARQTKFVSAMSLLRKKFIEIKNLVSDREDDIRALEKIGEHCSLQYYEKLKSENRLHSDRIEEKETELTLVRKYLQDTIQIISHMREKLTAMAQDIDDLVQEIDNLTDYIEIGRRRLNKVKSERDSLRSQTVTLKNESGLLLHPELLRDLEKSRTQHGLIKKELNELMDDCNLKVRHLQNARKTLEMVVEQCGRSGKKRKATHAPSKKSINVVSKVKEIEPDFSAKSSILVKSILTQT